MVMKVAAISTSVFGFSCQVPDMAVEKRIAQGRFAAITKPVNRIISALDFVTKMSRALIGRPASAKQSRRLGNSDCH